MNRKKQSRRPSLSFHSSVPPSLFTPPSLDPDSFLQKKEKKGKKLPLSLRLEPARCGGVDQPPRALHPLHGQQRRRRPGFFSLLPRGDERLADNVPLAGPERDDQDLSRGGDGRQGQADPQRRGLRRALDADDPPAARGVDVDGGEAGEQRGDVAVGADSEKHEVELGHLALPVDGEDPPREGAEARFVLLRGVVGAGRRRVGQGVDVCLWDACLSLKGERKRKEKEVGFSSDPPFLLLSFLFLYLSLSLSLSLSFSLAPTTLE